MKTKKQQHVPFFLKFIPCPQRPRWLIPLFGTPAAILNSKLKTHNSKLLFVFVLAACLCQPCLANPIAMDLEHIMFGPAGYGVVLNVLRVIAVDFLIDLCVLVVGFIMIRRARCLKTWKFIIYLPVVVIGGLAIDELSLCVEHALISSSLFGFLLTFSLLFAFNFVLCLKLFRLPSREVGTIAVLMGFLTHPSVYAELSVMFVFGILLLLLIGSYIQRAYSPEADSSYPQEHNHETPLVQVEVNNTEPRCSAVEIGTIVLKLSKLATDSESDQTREEIIQLGRKLDLLPRISSSNNLVYAFRTILEFLGEKEAQKIADIWEENGCDVRK